MRKICVLLLAVLILLTGFPISPDNLAKAEATDTTSKEYKLGAWFQDGKLIFVTPNKKASTPVKYGTKAFIFREDTKCNGDDPSTSKCTPAQGNPEKDYLRIDLYNPDGTYNSDWTVQDIGECDYLHDYLKKEEGLNIPAQTLHSQKRCQQLEYGSSARDAIVVTRFEVPKDVMTAKLSAHEKFQNWKDGMRVYMNAVFLIKYNDVPAMTPEYTTLEGIRSAKDWSDPSYFRNYYDVPVTFYGSYPIKVRSLLETNRSVELEPERNIESKFGPPDYETGLWPAWKYSKADSKDGNGIQLKETITYNNQVYTLQCSYITRIKAPETKNCSETGNEPYWVRGNDLLERNPAVYVGGTYVVALYSLADCECFTTATLPNKEQIEGEVPADNKVIGQKVTMQVDLQQTDQKELDNWKKWVQDKTDFTIRIRVYRSDNDKITGLSNTGAQPIWSSGSTLEPATNASPNLTNSVSKEQLLAYLEGGAASKVLFYDDLEKYPIPEGGKVSFRYNADVFISAKDQNGNIITKQCDRPRESPDITWFRPMKPKVNVGNFFSIPKYYSEIKEGAPELTGTSTTETFDAMSGMPTTRNLYFASGGSEFIVDIQVEYVPQVTQTRTYKSEFTSVINGWAMSKIEPGWTNDTQPPRPTPRKMVDACNVPYEEIVEPKSQPYVKGYTSGPDPQPIMGTQYRWVQHGYPSTKVGGYTDTWTQTVTFDYMKINKVAVWKLERSKVDGMKTLVGTEEVTASIVQGNPSYFMNIAAENTSKAGRLRYSLETDQDDSVYWNEGPSDNCLSNSKTAGPVNEQQKFNERRNMTTNVTAISDFLILQTSSGDQSVMYFEKTSNTAKTTEQLDVPTSDFDTMWTNNPLSAAKWNQKDTIKVGSYNGQYGSPTVKYSGAGGGTVPTIFDTKPLQSARPARPSAAMRLMQTNLDIPNTLKNGEYVTGSSSVFYKLMFTPYNPNNLPITYNTGTDSLYGQNGQSFTSAYSPLHQKVNNVVIHNPVSVQHAMVVSLPNSLDQRTPASRAIGGNKQEGVAEYERVLDPDYRQNLLANPDAEYANANGTVAGWLAWGNQSSGINFTSRTGDQWVISGTRSFEINTASNPGGAGTHYVGVYYKDVPVKPNASYSFDGKISCHRCHGYFYIDLYNSNGTRVVEGLVGGSVTSTSVPQTLTIDFTTGTDVTRARIHMVKGNSGSDSGGANDYMFADDLRLRRMDVQEFVAIEPVQVTQVVENPDYKPASSGETHLFEYTGARQEFVAPVTGKYTLELWGASGGYFQTEYGKGGYAKGDINLNEGDILHLHVGGKGGNTVSNIDGGDSYNNNGGWNGGGSGTGRAGPGGGGGTDIRFGGTTIDYRIIVAGGGGGASVSSTIAYGGYEKTTNMLWQGENGDTSRHNSSYPNDEGGGGGGYYGGRVQHGDDPRNSHGGSSWVGNLSNTVMIPGNSSMPAPGGGTQIGQSGHGAIRITSPPQAQVGSPTKIITTLVGGSDTSPPSDAYILRTVAVNPATPADGYTPGKFVLLDYEFTLHFPNTGDFYGNGQWGWSQTTNVRGKGFTDNMDTTEWTQAKYVKFNFNVIYDNVLYRANEWIPLYVPQKTFSFYVPLANREQVSALVEWKSVAINAAYEDNDVPTNKVRHGNLAANHSTLKKYQVDVVGRIGNMVIEDTGDFRFSNLFKQPLVPEEWFVQNVVRRVNSNVQRGIVGATVDIRGKTVESQPQYLNTWGLLSHLQQGPLPFPLSPHLNNIAALQRQPLRLGYEILTDIQTMGNYYSNLQITPVYYHLNLLNGEITKVDIYMLVDAGYKLINKHDDPTVSSNQLYNNQVFLDWEKQAGRRNVRAAELDLTTRVAGLFAESGGDTAYGKAAEPSGNESYGNTQFMRLTGKNRTYIGQERTHNKNNNPGNRLSMLEYAMQAQRWHYSFALPSSAVAVKQNLPATQANINELRTNNGVIILAAQILAVGDTYTLEYTVPGGNGILNLADTSWSLAEIPYPVIAVYSTNKSSADDLQITGTH